MDNLISELSKKLEKVKSSQELSELKAKYLGKKGSITSLSS